MAKSKVIVGIIDDPDLFLDVGTKARDKKYKGLDGIMPYPVHGFEESLGLKKSWLPSAAKLMLVVGAGLGFLFQAWTSAVDWPINVGGKPLISWQAFIPVVFESGVLLAGITTFFALMHVGRFFPTKNARVIKESLTDDQFALLVPVKGNGNRNDIIEFFKGAGIDDVKEILY
jgi:Alternative complex III, ActD subunit